jgi:hypothetical protein
LDDQDSTINKKKKKKCNYIKRAPKKENVIAHIGGVRCTDTMKGARDKNGD